jgi:hypothetical protein
MSPLYANLNAWLVAMLPAGVTVYVRDQNAPTPPNPRVTMRIAAMTDIAHYRNGITETGEPDAVVDEAGGLLLNARGEAHAASDDVITRQALTRWVGFTLALEFYGENIFEAETMAADMLDLCRFDELRIDHLGRTATFNRVLAGPNSIDATFGAQIEPRTTLDLAMSATRERLLDVGPIETAEVAASVGDLTYDRIVP